MRELEQLHGLEPLVKDTGFLHAFRAAKQANKQRLVDYVRDTLWIDLEPTAIFDVQVKRLHEYKRQLLNALHIVALWIASPREPGVGGAPAGVPLRGQGRAGLSSWPS